MSCQAKVGDESDVAGSLRESAPGYNEETRDKTQKMRLVFKIRRRGER